MTEYEECIFLIIYLFMLACAATKAQYVCKIKSSFQLSSFYIEELKKSVRLVY